MNTGALATGACRPRRTPQTLKSPMKYFVTDRNDDILGPHTSEEIANLRASGAIEATALCCEVGADAWSPLDSIFPPGSQPAGKRGSEAKPAPKTDAAGPEQSEPARDAAPAEEPRKMEPAKSAEPLPAAKRDGEPASKGANPVVLVCVLLVLALILFGAYYLGSRL